MTFDGSEPTSANTAGAGSNGVDDVTVPIEGGTAIPGLIGYRNLELIAHGSTAVVFRGDQARLNRKVAIKVLLVDDVMTTDDTVQRELDTLVRLSSSPHIVSIIDTGITDVGQPYIVMEYCEGGSYAQILKERGPLSVAETLEVGIKIGEALHAAHEVGIIHRDVKPPNILRSRFGPALTDFGIAYAIDGSADTTTLQKLTPHHASPETLLQYHQSGQSDLYSLASTMWNLLAGRPPFESPGQDPEEFRRRVMETPVPRVPRADVPDWLQHEIGRAMAKRAADRHPTALAFAETLRLHMARTSVNSPYATQEGEPDALTIYYAPTNTEQLAAGSHAAGPPQPPITAPGSDAPPSYPPVVSPNAFSAPPAVSPGMSFGANPISVPPAFSADVSDGASYEHAPYAPQPGGLPPMYPTDTNEAAARPTYLDDDEDDEAEQRSRRPLLTAGIVGVILGLLAVIGLLVANNKQSDQGAATPTPSASASLVNHGAPRNLRLGDNGDSITLSWKDTAHGKARFLITGAQTGEKTRWMGQTGRGDTKFTISGVNSTIDYCFQVVTVLSNEAVAPSDPACTSRLGGGASPNVPSP